MSVCVCVCRELEALQGDVVESKLTMDGKQKVGVATSKFITTTLGLPFNREVAMVYLWTLSLQKLVSKRKRNKEKTLFLNLVLSGL